MVSREGVIFEQPQVHHTQAHPWSHPGDALNTIDLAWGRFGILVGDDSIYPEAAKVLAISDADVIAIPFHVREVWELEFGLIDRSTENRVCIVAASRPTNFGGSLIIDQWKDFQIFTPWTQREFTGTINEPIVSRTGDKFLGIHAIEIHPDTARYKTMSYETDLIQGRPWKLLKPLITPLDARQRKDLD